MLADPPADLTREDRESSSPARSGLRYGSVPAELRLALKIIELKDLVEIVPVDEIAERILVALAQ